MAISENQNNAWKRFSKAEDSLASAQRNAAFGDFSTAINRAYYSMFYASQAALLKIEIPVNVKKVKTHQGLYNLFYEHLIKDGKLPEDLAKILAYALNVRIMSDYDDDKVDIKNAHSMVNDASHFLDEVKVRVMKEKNQDVPK